MTQTPVLRSDMGTFRYRNRAMATLNGTDASELITGGAENDTLIGDGSSDTLDGGGG